ncbi:Golgi SNAP receptor complex member 2 [Guillardia theta CCMP2712]|uniref:Golgi SNAP receptor complex member 2 n=1 Tax=Guillardia theta (strain CCMP2712) TaxID=905079 RepID=L1JU50_GUITC|nr:Golgi SNAP receptor complex member 2 [Guillardia theta CCMP2712]EKX51814.1 Golgi SNAP receptor complex member 2 [Guillardia theta CCMP2712]|eukprot:XP_005838794.1 Golgi SNAP receptor complex member 2 [Guillardia theta CCMP2712]
MSLTLDEQYKNSRKLSMTIESIMTKVSTSPPEQAKVLLEDAKNKLIDTKGLVNSMEQLVLGEPAAKKDLWKNKVGNLREEFESLSRLYERERKRLLGKEKQEEERAQLFKDIQGGQPSDQESLDVESRMALQRSHAAIDELEERGAKILSNLGIQREQLKNVHKKVLDVMNTLGVSNSLIRVIEKRQAMDIILLFAGMIGTVFILVMVWIYFRRK